MKILYVCNMNPFKRDSGGHQRGVFILRALRTMGKVDVLYLHNHKETSVEKEGVTDCLLEDEDTGVWHKRIRQVVGLLRLDATFTEATDKRCIHAFQQQLCKENYDLIFFRYLKPYLQCGMPMLPNMVLDVDDLPWQNSECIFRNKSYSSQKRLYHGYRYVRVRYHACRLFVRFRATFYSNKVDMRGRNSYYLPNIPCTNLVSLQPTVSMDKHGVLFVGTLSHVPNYEGLDHFITMIWPSVLRRISNANLYVVGKGLPASMRVKWDAAPRVHQLGFVESLPDVYYGNPIVISPIYSGAGTNIKVLEALSYKRICVISEFSWRGFDDTLKDGEDLLVCRSDEEFVDKLCRVLENFHAYSGLGEHGAEQVARYYSEDSFKEIITKAIEHEFKNMTL